MSTRRIASLTALISFIFEILTSVTLYIVPQGRVAYWSDWHLWGLSKSQWGDLHINLGVLFLLSIVLHGYYNWSLLTKYMNNQAKKLTVFTADFNIALLLTVVFILGTYVEAPPFSTILNFSASIKDKAAITYGEPPYGHAELSTLQSFTKKTDLDLDESLSKLRAAGIKVTDKNQTLAQIATVNNLTPKEIFLLIKPDSKNTSNQKKLPPLPPGGFGQKTIGEVCREYALNCEKILQRFTKNDVPTDANMSLKEVGAKYQRNPHDLYDLLK